MRKRLIALSFCLTQLLCVFSESTSDSIRTDSVKISIDEIRTANSIFIEHEYYKKVYPLMQNENNRLRNMVSHYARIDSVSVIRISETTVNLDKEKKRSKKRLRWAVLSTLTNAILLYLLIK